MNATYGDRRITFVSYVTYNALKRSLNAGR